ncbi:MAG: cellobiose phosphorylase, partial [Candidatus Cloacimonetes bacterium]|nr:cellobiose phosphorylase [Candidatus Cloacimonadota bacterium]
MAASNKAKYNLNETGEFIITDYNSSKLFSSFFPGVAGKLGIPMWLFYVNRGQCVCSMGIEGKDKPIMEFLPANRAYQLTSSQGFRTFIKPLSHDSIKYYEPFQNNYFTKDIEREQKMIIAPARLTLEEKNYTLGLKFSVDYFNVTQDKYAGLVRILRIQNLNEDAFELEGMDGLPLIIPYGIDNLGLKYIRRLVEAFVEVSNYETGIPFFRGKVEPADRPEVVHIKKGNFYIGFDDDEKLVSPIVDPVKVFGSQSDYNYPERFLTDSYEEMYEGQILENRLPCALGHFKASIPAGGTYTYTSIIGHASSIEELNELVPVISNHKYAETKQTANKDLIDELTQKNFICSNESVLNMYSKQNFLDNILRGGFPHTLNGNGSKIILHLYSRKHGDLERDYNDYRLNPTHYSQGNG